MQSVWSSLMTTDSGWMTLGVFLFMLGMGVFFVVFFMRKIRDDEARQRHDAAGPSGHQPH
jgi:heme/copper-type cytochrome/quinol oxidase subunit 2